jgi:hypothetical protein
MVIGGSQLAAFEVLVLTERAFQVTAVLAHQSILHSEAILASRSGSAIVHFDGVFMVYLRNRSEDAIESFAVDAIAFFVAFFTAGFAFST